MKLQSSIKYIIKEKCRKMSCQYKERCYRTSEDHLRRHHRTFTTRKLVCQTHGLIEHELSVGGDWKSSRGWYCKLCGRRYS